MPGLRYIARALLPPKWRARLRNTLRHWQAWLPAGSDPRMLAEQQAYAGQEQVHALPTIHHYWAERYLRPLYEHLGYRDVEHFFELELARAYDLGAGQDQPVRLISLGAGNCELEVRLARALTESGRARFLFECLEVNPAMRERGAQLAADAGLSGTVVPVPGDFNAWTADGHYAAVLANQSLHHVLALESLFDAVLQAIGTSGAFLVSDIIGRNGHQRWPEALALVQQFWTELPPGYRYNLQLHRRERRFKDWDCSIEGFEGIRAQDVLPLLLQRFGFRVFLAWGNVIDPFIDRAFGPHFDPGHQWDREFIDRVQEADQAAILEGRIKPTHMCAVLCGDRHARPRTWRHLTPEFCVRAGDAL